ncbi:hypothetical protein Val02_28960 [Virgisporangium aliadipatigenens]|uniref:MerR family transcriptional regulator n=1 Tax=Virgisporangium aliadipatigenens TaxID=741659 RepID=A0A8J3YL77_9ACTN|nr:MerR family transcriptional regulator [Virgisporangium aliadipatigenens]GIJ46010.1 hypothetical protein Val02_28960 [Virgisporangium aliadipatigenens]
MALLTIGAFARAARLTPKALRLYDELGLLPPAAVDPENGYRLYDPAQLARARLIAALRRVGMPLADVRATCDLPPAAAAEAVDAYWRRVTTHTAARAQQVAALVAELTGRSTAVSDNDSGVTVRHAAACVTGRGRDSNEDSAYAGDRLFAVADGARGPGGAAASATAVEALKPLERADAPPAELLALLADALGRADRDVRASATGDHRPVTTLTAILRSGPRLALVHIGDTRAYLLRRGELAPLTQDHTWVRTEVDQGRMTEQEAAAHPRRALLVRALGTGAAAVEADLALRTALPGDRYLLCSDGLSTVVGRDALRETLLAAEEPEDAVRRLVELAYAAGAPDNVACVVADIVAA